MSRCLRAPRPFRARILFTRRLALPLAPCPPQPPIRLIRCITAPPSPSSFSLYMSPSPSPPSLMSRIGAHPAHAHGSKKAPLAATTMRAAGGLRRASPENPLQESWDDPRPPTPPIRVCSAGPARPRSSKETARVCGRPWARMLRPAQRRSACSEARLSSVAG